MSLLSSIVYILVLHHLVVHIDALIKTVTPSQADFTSNASADHNYQGYSLQAGASSLGEEWSWMRFTHGLSSVSVISDVQLTVKLCDVATCGDFGVSLNNFQMEFFLCTFDFDGELHNSLITNVVFGITVLLDRRWNAFFFFLFPPHVAVAVCDVIALAENTITWNNQPASASNIGVVCTLASTQVSTSAGSPGSIQTWPLPAVSFQNNIGSTYFTIVMRSQPPGMTID
jgi:hypothetical protein